MSKPEVNNQIVLMRKDVIQARVHIIKKLSRDAKKLRDKKGTDMQKAKNLRKANRIAAEILAVKNCKKEEIIHFALTNALTLDEILQDRTSDPLKRIKARIANHKKFSMKIAEFKEKYPNYLKLIEPGRKKRAILERKEKKEKSKELKKTNKKVEEVIKKDLSDESYESDESNETDDNDIKSENVAHDTVNCDSEEVDKSKELNTSSIKIKSIVNLTNSTIKIKKGSIQNMVNNKSKILPSDEEKEKKDIQLENKPDSLESKKSKKKKKVVDVTKAVSKVATVKKFADILQEEVDSYKNFEEQEMDSKILNTDVEKEIDPFFVTENGDSNFLSVAPRKRKLNLEENKKMEFIKFNPEKGPPNKFSKNNDFKYDSDKSNSKWRNQRNDRFKFDSMKSNYKERNGNQWNKKGFNKINDESNQKQISRKERRAAETEGSENLHPSWEAKKKQQDALKQGFQGKKIVFSDD